MCDIPLDISKKSSIAALRYSALVILACCQLLGFMAVNFVMLSRIRLPSLHPKFAVNLNKASCECPLLYLADMGFMRYTCPLLRCKSGHEVLRLHMSACDPNRTSRSPSVCC